MADKSVNSIEEQIRKLVEEKEELERISKEKQRHAKENASTPRGIGSSNIRDLNRDYGDLSENLSATLLESQARIRSIQQQHLQGSSKDGASNLFNDSRDDSLRSGDDADDDVMTQEHKQILRVNRDVLVENMTPDDIFNDLISKQILTNTDVSRIKDRNTTEAINEELLNVLCRRSDRAFYVFVASLRRTLQGWLANRLEPESQQRNKRKRRTGEIDVNLNCEQIVPASKKRHTCTCQEVEEQLLVMAKGALSHIRRKDGTSASFEQFKKELKQTNEAIMETMETVNALKILCHHGEITDMTEGSVCFTISCSSLSSCQALWEAYESGILLKTCQQGLVTPTLLRICGARQIHLHVRISRLEYLTCAIELAKKEKDLLMQHRPACAKKMSRKKACLAQDENMSGELTKLFLHNKAQAFMEIPVNTVQDLYYPREKNFENGHKELKSLSSATHYVSTGRTKNLFGNDAQVLQPTEQFVSKPRSNIWLRSHMKENQSSHKCMLNKITLNKLDEQLTNRGIETLLRAKQVDACPYNLRYRLLNPKELGNNLKGRMC